MEISKNIKVAQVFDGYSEFYQPYIPPVMAGLQKENTLAVEIFAFKKGAHDNVTYIPSYYRRKFKEKLYNLTRAGTEKLTYAEIVWLQNKMDIVHLQHSYLFPKVAGLLTFPPEKRPKIMITLRGGDTYVKPWVQEKWKDFYHNTAKHIDAFVVMSDHQKMYLHEKWGVALERIHVIPISFGEKFETTPKNPDPETIKMASVFRMCWEKNIDGNLRVVQHLVSKGLPVQYDIFGSGPDAGQVWYLIDKYGLSKNVTYHGRLANTILKERLDAADFFLQLSHSEAFPTTVIEAQAKGIPALVSNAGGLPAAIVPDKSGYVVATNEIAKGAEAIASLWKNPAAYSAFSQAAIVHAQSQFSVTDEVRRLSQLYLKLKLSNKK